MRFWKKSVLFYLGGATYMTLEFLWRGRSHGSMFLLGGLCFCVLGKCRSIPVHPVLRVLLGASAVTGLELAAGLLVNRDYRIWDYRGLPLHFRGQICLPYCLLWVPLSLAAFYLYGWAERGITALTFGRKKVK